MDSQMPAGQSPLGGATLQPPEKKQSGLMFLEIGILEIFFVIIGLLILLGSLNYFSIINLSSISPSLSFLPQKQKIAENKTQAKPTLSQAELYKKIKNELSFSGCPAKQEICKNAEIISDSKSTQSAQWILKFLNLPENTEILAVLDGDVKINKTEKDGQTQTVITLTNEGRLLKAYYEFDNDSFEKASTSAAVKQGDVLGKINDKNQGFNFYLKNTTTDNYVPVKPSPDGKNLLYAGL